MYNNTITQTTQITFYYWANEVFALKQFISLKDESQRHAITVVGVIVGIRITVVVVDVDEVRGGRSTTSPTVDCI